MMPRSARIVFLGMDSVYSARVLAALYERGHDIRAVIKPFGGLESRRKAILTRSTYFTGMAARAVNKLANKMPLPARDETDPFHIAGLHGAPCYLVGNASARKVREMVEKLDPELICIAFFNQLLRKKMIATPSLATLNAHPSLLPAYRGPSPLFWMFKNGEQLGGVSVHLVDTGEDSGAIAAREEVEIRFGESGPEYLDRLADVAARLMVRAVDAVLDDSIEPQVQDPALASRYARPGFEDLRVEFERPAEQVYRMVRGLQAWAPLWIELDGERLRVTDAVGLEREAELGADLLFSGDTLAVQCQPGVVVLKVAGRGPAAHG